MSTAVVFLLIAMKRAKKAIAVMATDASIIMDSVSFWKKVFTNENNLSY